MASGTFGAAWRADRQFVRSPFLWGLASLGTLLLGALVHLYFLPTSPILAVVALVFYRQRKTERDGADVAGLVLAVLALLLSVFAVSFTAYLFLTWPKFD
jgi:hypothetical protein